MFVRKYVCMHACMHVCIYTFLFDQRFLVNSGFCLLLPGPARFLQQPSPQGARGGEGPSVGPHIILYLVIFGYLILYEIIFNFVILHCTEI